MSETTVEVKDFTGGGPLPHRPGGARQCRPACRRRHHHHRHLALL